MLGVESLVYLSIFAICFLNSLLLVYEWLGELVLVKGFVSNALTNWISFTSKEPLVDANDILKASILLNNCIAKFIVVSIIVTVVLLIYFLVILFFIFKLVGIEVFITIIIRVTDIKILKLWWDVVFAGSSQLSIIQRSCGLRALLGNAMSDHCSFHIRVLRCWEIEVGWALGLDLTAKSNLEISLTDWSAITDSESIWAHRSIVIYHKLAWCVRSGTNLKLLFLIVNNSSQSKLLRAHWPFIIHTKCTWSLGLCTLIVVKLELIWTHRPVVVDFKGIRSKRVLQWSFSSTHANKLWLLQVIFLLRHFRCFVHIIRIVWICFHWLLQWLLRLDLRLNLWLVHIIRIWAYGYLALLLTWSITVHKIIWLIHFIWVSRWRLLLFSLLMPKAIVMSIRCLHWLLKLQPSVKLSLIHSVCGDSVWTSDHLSLGIRTWELTLILDNRIIGRLPMALVLRAISSRMNTVLMELIVHHLLCLLLGYSVLGSCFFEHFKLLEMLCFLHDTQSIPLVQCAYILLL